MRLPRELTKWLGKPRPTRARPENVCRLSVSRLETREVPAIDLLAVASSRQPLIDLQNVAAAFNLNSSIDFARSGIVLAGNERSILQISLTSTANSVATMQTLTSTGLYSSLTVNRSSAGVVSDVRERTPNDPLFTSQNHHAIIKTPQAWDTTIGKSDVIVAILDDGVSINHPDLRLSLWSNLKETPGDGIDNDGNGFTDDLNGWNFVGRNNNVNPTDPVLDPHGTQVAGLLSAQFNNAEGVAGVAGGANLMPLKVVGPGGTTDVSTLVSAIGYAVVNGAKIINTSINIDPFVDDPTFQAALALAYERDILLVNSAGNQSTNNPARAGLDELILVAATDRNDIKTNYSNFGSGIDIAAPGGTSDDGLRTTIPVAGYGAGFGTSMSAPLVAGTAALVWSAHPSYTRDQVAAAVIATADSLAAKNPNFLDRLGSGRVNAARSVSGEKIVTGLGKLTGLPAEGAEAPATLTTFNLRLKSPLDPGTVTTSNFELRYAGQDNQFGTNDDALLPYTINDGREYKIGTNDLRFAVNRNLEQGLYRFTAKSGGLRDPFGTAIDGDGNGIAGGNLVRNFGVAYQLRGTVYTDVRNDGIRNSTDPGQSGVGVFADLNGNGQLDRVTFSSTSGELIPDLATSTIRIPVSGISTVIGSLRVTVNITHRRPSDLTITVMSPDGTRVRLFDRGVLPTPGTAASRSLIFEDGILESSESFPTIDFNELQPTEPLANFIGLPASGDWFLEVTDEVLGEEGTLDGASITFANEPTATSDENGNFSFDVLPSDTIRFGLVAAELFVPAADIGFVSVDLRQPSVDSLSLGVVPRMGISGQVFRDTGGGTFAGAVGLADTTLFLDRNFNSLPDLGEESTTTDEFGNYVFANLPTGTYQVRLSVPPSFAALSGVPINQQVTLTGGTSSARGIDFLVQANPAPPVADLIDVMPKFRNSPVNFVTLNLSEPLPNLSLSGFSLTHDGFPVPLDGTTLIGSGTRYQLLGLGERTKASGEYRLVINAPSPVGQPNRKPILESIQWTTDAEPPQLRLQGIVENDIVKGVTVLSNEPLSSFNLNALSLTADGRTVEILGSDVTASPDGSSYTVIFARAVQTRADQILVLLNGANSGIQDLAGNEYVGSTGFAFQRPVGPQRPGVLTTRTVVGSDVGGPPVVNVYDGKTSNLLVSLPIFELGFTGGIRVAAGDVNGDTVEDIIAVAGPGGGPRVRVIDGATFLNIADFAAFEESFQGGLFVSCGDFNGDGKADVVLSADVGGGPRVRVVNLADLSTIHDFFAIEDAAFRGGSRTAVGDVNADGLPDLVVAAGSGGGPRISVYDGRTLGTDRRKLIDDFFAFDPNLRNGTFLAVGDLNQDGFADIAFGSGAGGGPRIQAISGKSLTAGELSPMVNFFAGDTNQRSGVRVAIKGTGNAVELYTADGVGVGSRVRIFSQAALAQSTPNPTREFDAFDELLGVFVG